MLGENLVLIDTAVLPEVFIKIIEAKQLLACGKAKSLSDAAGQVGISRSTFYKYKDSVFSYEPGMAQQIATLTAELEDRSGVLSKLLTTLSSTGANILTINQNIPVDGVAPVSISFRTGSLTVTITQLASQIKALDGVVTARVLSS